MLSGAHDILKKLDPNLGTGAVLLADILPTLLIKSTGPMFLFRFSYSVRIVTCIIAALVSFLLVAFSTTVAMALAGVVFASISAGLGEITFLSMTACYHKSVISAWSSGTGGAGVVGALAYLGLTEVVSPSQAQLVMTCIPALMAISYFAMLTHRPKSLIGPAGATPTGDPYTFKQKLAMTKRLVVPFMLPLFVVYWSEYMINQGIFENMLWPHQHISTDAQYRLYQLLYQIGVFLSRSSLAIFALSSVWIPAVVQMANFAVLFVEARVHFFPGIWLTCIWIIFEGLLGGLVYVNAFALISKRTKPEHREFSMSIASVADSCGIALAGACSLAINAYLRHHQRT
ncbi:hypothetical protein PTSG_03402 [Salpingoeca rosetta]|uniref:Battenin n=1 Tax=Salpingoeca rosetta (strain ATCC 50818 / BSB-021) TaxID=946362 RepID=F2U535_SALR5|nr:uncharacterized protein PTSG_03402 [Salpingoeca rosetta]EGD82751.1 hypothetical protein PTSG_03402 [Salpingoeca rosetta]|eukprot:XP_004995987.1 hypothetical protein PTSG_03402 [Salpingoeca rosetta]